METKEIEQKAISITAQANAISVVDQASYDVADSYSAAAKALLKAVDESYDPIIEAAHASHKTAIEQKKKQYNPIAAAKKIIDDKMISWYKSEQEKAEKKRREAEDAARKEAEDRQIESAEILASMGLDGAAEEALSADPIVARIKVDTPAKALGVSYRENYSAEIVSLVALVKAISDGKAPIEAIEANMVYLNGRARLDKGAMSIPGVKVVVSTSQGRRG